MRIKLLLFFCLAIFSSRLFGQSVVVNKIYNNTSTEAGGSVNGQGDAVEFLVLEDHTDLRGAYFKDFYNMNANTTMFVEGSQWQLSNDNLWADLRAGTTIVFIRPALSPIPAPETIIDPVNYKIQFPLSATASDYVNQITTNNTYTFNPQGRDGIVLKKGNSPNGFDNLIHFCLTGYSTITTTLKAEFDAVGGAKMALGDILPGSTSGTGTNGYLFARNPTAENNPENGLVDYTGVDEDPSDIMGWWQRNTPAFLFGEGEPNGSNCFNEKFITYLRASPKIESIMPENAPANSPSIVFKVVFSKPVTFAAITDFDLVTTGTVLGTISSVSGSGTEYNVTVSDLSGIGDIKLITKSAGLQITDGTNKMFNGFSYDKSASHAVNLDVVLLKPNTPIIEGSVNGAVTSLSPIISGDVIPNATVNLYVDGVKVNSVIKSDANGAWQYQIIPALTAGQHSFYITVSAFAKTSEASDVLSVNLVSYVTGIAPVAKGVVVNKMFNSGASADDVFELLVLDDHVDLAGLFVKDQAGNTSSSTAYNDNGGKYEFKNIDLWRNLRSGTTIVLRRNPSTNSGYVLDADPSDYKLDLSLDDTNYFDNVGGTSTFNIQNYDMVILKGGTNASGYDNIIHAFISGVNNSTRSEFNSFPEPKIGINALIPTSNGFLYANNPTAVDKPHLGIADYVGFTDTDKPTTVTAGTTVVYNPEPPIIKTTFNDVVPNYGTGEPGNNEKFISYLRVAPKIESIIPAIGIGKGSSVIFTVTFNKNVTGVDVNDFRVLAKNTANGAVASVTGTGNTYQVLVNELSGDGEIILVKRAESTAITDGTNLFLEGFEYLKCNPYIVDDLPVVIPVPDAPVIDGVVNGNSDNFTPTVYGIVRPGVTVNLYIDGTLINAQINSGTSGRWSYQLSTPLSIGSHTFYITTTASYGTSQQSAITTVNFALQKPDAPTVAEAVNGITNSFRPTLTGTVKPNMNVNLYIDDVLYNETVTADVNGEWSISIIEPLVKGSHSFRITVSNNNGESERSEETVVLFKLFTGEVTANNILTPNGDGKNDIWTIDNLDLYPNNEVMVYNKVGKVVFNQKNYQQNWDGTSNGEVLKSGTYYYHISFGPDLPPLKGYLTILNTK